MRRRAFRLALGLAALPLAAVAYVGPGAGFAFVGSFLSLLAAFLVGFASLAIWPFRALARAIRGAGAYRKAKAKKVVFLGLDGLEPALVDRFLAEGKLPNLASLRDRGRYSLLRTTFPPLSPVAWSTFATGSNPGKHQMFDFLNRRLKSYVPELASSRVEPPRCRFKIGRRIFPLGGPAVEQRRKSKTFWSLLGERRIDSTILRVPITFPPEKFQGKMLSAMCTPDLLGTQGSFQEFTTASAEADFEAGFRRPLRVEAGVYRGAILGPENSAIEGGGPIEIPFTLKLDERPGRARLELPDAALELELGRDSEWVRLTFRAALGVAVTGLAKFRLTATEPNVALYVSPISIDPEAPALPISQPGYFAAYLSKLHGEYSTLGLAEDTWALNERVIDEDAFLEQAYSICDERERMWFSTLDKLKRGVAACVFDTPDRVQHMFFRYLDPSHPAHAANGDGMARYAGAIEDLYRRMDAIVGHTLEYVDENTVLFVLSDHGFKSFRRGVDLNAWLRDNGYLALRQGADGEKEPYLRAVDWRRTRAYSFGLAGIYLNVRGREGQGVVDPKEAPALVREIAAKLTGLTDPATGQEAVRRAYPKGEIYSGPYTGVAPDIVVGYAEGYRASWTTTVGKVGRELFEDNRRAWSGDHCIDPPLIPGVLFCNRAFDAADPGIEDLGPTCLDLFGLTPPGYMDGRPIGVAAQG